MRLNQRQQASGVETMTQYTGVKAEVGPESSEAGRLGGQEHGCGIKWRARLLAPAGAAAGGATALLPVAAGLAAGSRRAAQTA